MAKPRIVLSNSYGTRNVGDEAILTVLVCELRHRGFDVSVLAFAPEETARRHPGASAIRSGLLSGLPATCSAIRDADALVVGGGGILQDATSLGNLLFHASRPMMAALVSTPIVIAGVGIGPLKRNVSKRFVRWLCGIASGVDVRDAYSARQLSDIGVLLTAVRQGADFAHLLSRRAMSEMDDDGVAIVDALRKMRNKGRTMVGLSLRPPVGSAVRRARLSCSDRAHLERMACVADTIVETHDAQIVFVSMHPQQDDPLGAALVESMRNRNRVFLVSGRLPPATIKAAVAELDLMLGTRLHSLIFAASEGVTPLAMSYDEKVAAYMQSLDLGRQVLRRDEWHVDSILRRVQQSIEASAQIREQLEVVMPGLRATAHHSVDRICEIAQGRY